MALRPHKAIVRFELLKGQESIEYRVEQLWSSWPQHLDATLLRPNHPIAQDYYAPIAKTLPLADGQQRAYIIGHPQGRALFFFIHHHYFLDYDDK